MRVGGVDVRTLARSYGTPLIIMDGDEIIGRLDEYKRAFENTGYPRWKVTYAAKAFFCLAAAQLMDEAGAGIDVVSGGELYTALAAGFPAERIIFHGNNKSDAELAEALKAGVGRIVIDNFHELERLPGLIGSTGARRIRVMLRIAPGVDAHTHPSIDTGGRHTKFGFDLAGGQAMEAVARTLAEPALELTGFHFHIGSQIMSLAPYRRAVDKVLEFAGDVFRRHGYAAGEINVGGGLGIRYVAGDEPPSVNAFVSTVTEEVLRGCRRENLPLPSIIVEPGRSIVGEAGTTLYTVGSIKRVPGMPAFVAVDGGMSDNPRPALYDAPFTAVLQPAAPGGGPAAGSRHGPGAGEGRPAEECRIVGKLCESGDVIINSCRLPRPEPGDLIAVLSTGAYTFSMASRYNRLPRPAVVMLRGGRGRVIVKREHYRDLLRGEQPLEEERVLLPRRLSRWQAAAAEGGEPPKRRD